MYILLPVPYGLADRKLSAASLKALERALNFWTKSFSNIKPQIHLVLAAFSADPKELELRKELIARCGDIQLIELGVVRNEEELVKRLFHALRKRFEDIKVLTIFVEKTHARCVKPLFLRRFGSRAEFRIFRIRFEFEHNWVSTIPSPFTLFFRDFYFSETWFLRNLLVSFWFKLKANMSRGIRKKLRKLYRLILY